jgi:hypothetical protein
MAPKIQRFISFLLYSVYFLLFSTFLEELNTTFYKKCDYISITTPKIGFLVPILSKSVQKYGRYEQNSVYFLKCLSEFRFNETTDCSVALRGHNIQRFIHIYINLYLGHKVEFFFHCAYFQQIAIFNQRQVSVSAPSGTYIYQEI